MHCFFVVLQTIMLVHVGDTSAMQSGAEVKFWSIQNIWMTNQFSWITHFCITSINSRDSLDLATCLKISESQKWETRTRSFFPSTARSKLNEIRKKVLSLTPKFVSVMIARTNMRSLKVSHEEEEIC